MIELSFKFIHCYNKLGMYHSSYQKPMTFGSNFGVARYFNLEQLMEYEYKELNNSLTFSDHEKIEQKVKAKWNEFKDEFTSLDEKDKKEFFSWMKSNQVMSYFIYAFHPESFVFFTKAGFDFNQVSVPIKLLYGTENLVKSVDLIKYAEEVYDAPLSEIGKNYFKHELTHSSSVAESQKKAGELFYFIYTKKHFPQINTYDIEEFLKNKQTKDEIVKKLEKTVVIPLIDYINEKIINADENWLIAIIINKEIFKKEINNSFFMPLLNDKKINSKTITKELVRINSMSHDKEAIFSLANEETKHEFLQIAIEEIYKNLAYYLINHTKDLKKTYSSIDFKQLEDNLQHSGEQKQKDHEELKSYIEKILLEQNIEVADLNKNQKIKL
jgi:hypothetical protein